MKMRKLAVMAVAFVATLGVIGVVYAEEFRSPVLFKSDVNFDNGAIVKIKGATVTATASNLNTTAGSGTLTPSNVTMTGSFVATPQALVSVTNGQPVTLAGLVNLFKAINNAVNLTNTVTLANPSAAGQFAMVFNQKDATNTLAVALSGNFHGPALALAPGESAWLFSPTATNWAGIGQ